MNKPSASPLALNSCISCKQGKRKCNRVRPICSTCSRVGRSCTYEEDLPSPSSSAGPSQPIFGWPGPHIANITPDPSRPRIFSHHLNVDPFLHESLRAQTVNIGISQEAIKILGKEEDVRLMAENYLETMWQRFPIICRVMFRRQLPTIYTDPKADFIVLCLSIHLIMQTPEPGSVSMQSSLYVSIKTTMALLEASGFLSVRVLQARLLVCFYEVGHAIDTAASISIAGCGRIVQALGLDRKGFQEVGGLDEEGLMGSEQEKRVRWATILLDRFINLRDGYAIFATEDPRSSDHLPVDERIVSLNAIGVNQPLTLATPSDQRVGPFARECQISYLAGRVLHHVLEPTQDEKFHFEEALQLERTLLTFMPLLIEEGRETVLFCAALGICTSSLFTLYNSSLTSTPPPAPENRTHLLNSIESCASRIFGFSNALFAVTQSVDPSVMSPFTAYSQCQAALVMLRFWKETGEEVYRERMEVLRVVLGSFGRRWVGAGRYLRMLDERIAEWSEEDANRASFF